MKQKPGAAKIRNRAATAAQARIKQNVKPHPLPRPDRPALLVGGDMPLGPRDEPITLPVRRQRSLDRPGGLNKGEFLAHRNVHRSEDETANPTIEGTS